MDDLVVIASLRPQYEAFMLKSRLEAEGIECVLSGDRVAGCVGDFNALTTSWAEPLGGVKVLVRVADAAAARSIYENIRAEAKAEERPARGFPFALQVLVALVVAAMVQTMAGSIHPIFGWCAALVVFVALLASSFKRRSFK